MTGLSCSSARGGGAEADSAIGCLLRPRRVVVRDAGLRPALRKRDGRRRGQRKRKCHCKHYYEARCHGASPWSGGCRAGCPKRPVPLGKLHQRADRTSAACSRSMPPVPPRVREETHKPDELTSAAGCSTWSRRVARVPELADLGAHIIGTAPQANGTPFAIIPASISMNRKRGPVTVAAARCWRFRAATSHRPDRCLPVQAP